MVEASSRLDMTTNNPRPIPFISRVLLKNYKSIAICGVDLGKLTFLVGPNGSGKSNFVDGLRFVTDALRTSLDHALRDRGGIREVRRRSAGHPTHFSIRLEFASPAGPGHYAFRIGARARGEYEVQEEECQIGLSTFRVESGKVVRSSVKTPPAASRDRLYLVNASGLPEFRAIYEALSSMGFYNLNPDRIRALQSPDPGKLLARDGSNLASVLDQLAAHSKGTKDRIQEYLNKVVPGVYAVERKELGHMETLEFRQRVAGVDDPWRFSAAHMSDGTLRALGILVAIFQATNGAGVDVPLVAIEEPEVALHPAAAGVLRDGLREASRHTQLLVTSHSPDLLDDDELSADSILAVTAEDGTTNIGPLDAAGRGALHEQLYTPGELLRMNQLAPDPEAVKKVADKAPFLFDGMDS